MLRTPLKEEERSKPRIVRSCVNVKRWQLHGPPPVDVARPGRCPGCGAASRPSGLGLVLHGHGLRPRSVVAKVGHKPKITEILARRYVCLACDAVVLVVPAEVVRGHLYSLCVIASALAKWSHDGLSARAVRAEHSMFPVVGAASSGWPSLERWAATSSCLWPRIDRLPSTSARRVAFVICVKLAAHAPVPTGRVLEDAVAGAVHAV